MASDKRIQDAIDNLKEMQGGLGQLADMMDATQQVSDSLLTSFRDFATQGSSNTLWNAVSRFSSGIFPGFWSLQNKIRAVAVYMQYVEKKQKEQIKKEGEIAKTINKQAKVRMEAARTLAILNKDNISALEYQNLLEDDYFKSLVAKLGKEEALLDYRKKFNNQMMESLAGEVKLARHVKERIEDDIRYQDAYKNIGRANRQNLTEILYFKEQEKSFNDELLELEQQRSLIQAKDTRPLNKKGLPDKRFKNRGLSEEDKQMVETITKAIEKVTLEKDSAKTSSEFISKRSGVMVQKQLGTGLTVATQGEGEEEEEIEGESLGQMLKKKFLKRIEKIRKVISAIGVTVALIWKKGPIKMLGNFLKKGIVLFGMILMWIALAGIVVFFLIQSGIIGGIKDAVNWLLETTWFSDLMDSFSEIWDGVSMFFEGIFGFIHGLFTGDMDKVLEGLYNILGGLFKTAMGLVGGIFTFLGGWLVNWLFSTFPFIETLWGAAEQILIMMGTSMDDVKYYAKLIAVAAGAAYIWMLAGGGKTGAIALAGAVAVGGMVAKASGGRVNRGGNILVGEAGPEIVSLPTNSFVTPAQQSRGKMGNNITVQVNGRVGASDAELNEIARKIGQKINRQMNQYGSSGYRA